LHLLQVQSWIVRKLSVELGEEKEEKKEKSG